jgi:hypothetical protein
MTGGTRPPSSLAASITFCRGRTLPLPLAWVSTVTAWFMLPRSSSSSAPARLSKPNALIAAVHLPGTPSHFEEFQPQEMACIRLWAALGVLGCAFASVEASVEASALVEFSPGETAAFEREVMNGKLVWVVAVVDRSSTSPTSTPASLHPCMFPP